MRHGFGQITHRRKQRLNVLLENPNHTLCIADDFRLNLCPLCRGLAGHSFVISIKTYVIYRPIFRPLNLL